MRWNSQAADKNYAEEEFLARLPVTGSDVHSKGNAWGAQSAE